MKSSCIQVARVRDAVSTARTWLGDLLWFDCFNWLLPRRLRFWWWNVCWGLKGDERVRP